MGATRAQENRRIRQEALREQLVAHGHMNHVENMLNDLMDETKELTPEMVDRYKTAITGKLKLVGKYLPDDKTLEITGDPAAPLVTSISLEVVSADTPEDS